MKIPGTPLITVALVLSACGTSAVEGRGGSSPLLDPPVSSAAGQPRAFEVPELANSEVLNPSLQAGSLASRGGTQMPVFASLADAIRSLGGARFQALLDEAGLTAEIEASSDPLTVLLPRTEVLDAWLDAAEDLTGARLRAFLTQHIVWGAHSATTLGSATRETWLAFAPLTPGVSGVTSVMLVEATPTGAGNAVGAHVVLEIDEVLPLVETMALHAEHTGHTLFVEAARRAEYTVLFDPWTKSHIFAPSDAVLDAVGMSRIWLEAVPKAEILREFIRPHVAQGDTDVFGVMTAHDGASLMLDRVYLETEGRERDVVMRNGEVGAPLNDDAGPLASKLGYVNTLDAPLALPQGF
ncbi:MAG: fasciclin domain-containing protein [Myxococcota bacterium]